MALFSGRVGADRPYYYSDESILGKIAGGLDNVLSLGSGFTGAAGGLLKGGNDAATSQVEKDVVRLRMNSLCTSGEGGALPFVSICLDLLMYEDPQLFDAAIEAYIDFFMEIETVIHSLEKVQVLEKAVEDATDETTDVVTTEDATEAMNNLTLLQFQIDTFETWGEDTVFSKFDPATMRDVTKYMVNITNFLLVESSEKFESPDDISRCEPTETRQNIMFNYKAHETMKEIIEIDEPKEKPAEQTASHQLKDYAVAFLIMFVTDNPQNQRVVHDSMIDVLMDTLQVLEDAPELVAAIFKDNTQLCANVSDELLSTLMKVNYSRWDAKLPPKSDYLELFDAIVSADGAPNPENQAQVLDVLTQKQFAPLLFENYFRTGNENDYGSVSMLTEAIQDIQGCAGYQEFTSILDNFDKNSLMRSALNISAMTDKDNKPEGWDSAYMQYLTSLVGVLAGIARGKNTQGELKCQSLIPLAFVMALLENPKIKKVQAFRVAILTFLTEVFFDTDLSEFSTALANQQEFWTLMEGQCDDINQFAQRGEQLDDFDPEKPYEDQDDYANSEQHYVFNGILPSIEGFYRECLTLDNMEGELPEKETIKRKDLSQKLHSATKSLMRYKNKFSKGEMDKLEEVTTMLNEATGGESLVRMQTLGGKRTDHNSNHKAAPKATLKTKSGGLTVKLHDFVSDLKLDVKIKDEIAHEEERLVSNLLNIQKLTDKKEEVYKSLCDLSLKDSADLKKIGEGIKQNDPRDYAVTFSKVIVRMVDHIRTCCDESENLAVQRKTIWVLSKVLEHHLPPDVDRDDDTFEIVENPDDDDPYVWMYKALWWITGGLYGGGHLNQEQDSLDSKAKHIAMQVNMDEYGCSKLVIDVVGESKDEHVRLEAIKLGIEMLEFGNETVQNTMFEYLDELGPGADKFFSRINQSIVAGARLVRDRRQREKFVQKSGGQVEEPDEDEDEDLLRLDLVFRLLQLFTEGHNNNMQNLIRDQSSIGCRNTNNLLNSAVDYLSAVAKSPKQLARLTAGDAEDAIRVLNFLIEAVQGPCSQNQELLANSVLVDICSYIIGFPMNDKVPAVDRKELKGLGAQALLSLLEGRDDLVVVSQLAQKLDGNMIRRRMVVVHKEFLHLQKVVAQDSAGTTVSSGISDFTKSIRGGTPNQVNSDTKEVEFGNGELDAETMNMLGGDDWEEEFLNEGFDLLMLADRLCHKDAVDSSQVGHLSLSAVSPLRKHLHYQLSLLSDSNRFSLIPAQCTSICLVSSFDLTLPFHVFKRYPTRSLRGLFCYPCVLVL
jgi:hypothetical protein